MASKLTWVTITVAEGNTALHKAVAAEKAAVAKVNDLVASAVAAKHECRPEQVRIGRMYGNLSYAIDLEGRKGKNGETL